MDFEFLHLILYLRRLKACS